MNINEYFGDLSHFENKIIVISVKDEASRYISGFYAREALGIRMDIKFRDSYVAFIDPARDFLYEKRSASGIECSYRVGRKYIDVVSRGFEAGNFSSVRIGKYEYSLNGNGINVAVFKSRTLGFVDSFVCNSFFDKDLTVRR